MWQARAVKKKQKTKEMLEMAKVYKKSSSLHEFLVDIDLMQFTYVSTRMFTNPFVIAVVSCLNVMVAQGATHIVHAVHGLGHEVGAQRVHKIIVVGRGLPLQAVASVGQDKPLTILPAQDLGVAVDGRQAARRGRLAQVVVTKKRPMNVTRVNPLKMHFPRFGRERRRKCCEK